MFIQEDYATALYKIQRYEEGIFWINHQSYPCSVIIRPHALLAPWEPCKLSEILPLHFQSIYDSPPEIVLLGTGKSFLIPSSALIAPLLAKGIGVEFMDSKAACFTYMALACENRNVAACLLHQ